MSVRTTPAARAPLVVASAVSLAFVAAVVFDLLPLLRGPAPYPPEWQWQYRVPLAAPPAIAVALLLLAIAVAATVDDGGAARHRLRVTPGVAVAAAVVLGFALPLALLAREPGGALRTLVSRTSSASMTSYHTVAISEAARDPLAFVRGHADLLPAFADSAKHAATHPPGPVLLFRASVFACERWPSLRESLLGLAGLPDREFAWPLTRSARGGALLGALLLNLLAALTAWPLAVLGRELGLSPAAAARSGLLWAVLPGAALIAPRFDAAIALAVVGFAALVARALRQRHGVPSAGLAGLAGACAAVALQMSYGAALFLAIAGAAVLTASLARRDEPGRAAPVRQLGALVLAAAVAIALAFGVPALLGAAPARALGAALRIHREAYTAPRSYALWLAFNPVDFAALFGVALAILVGVEVVDALRALRRGSMQPLAVFTVTVAAGLALVLLSGGSRGEVGRLWMPLMPLLLVCVADRLRGRSAALVLALTAASTLAIGAAWLL